MKKILILPLLLALSLSSSACMSLCAGCLAGCASGCESSTTAGALLLISAEPSTQQTVPAVLASQATTAAHDGPRCLATGQAAMAY